MPSDPLARLLGRQVEDAERESQARLREQPFVGLDRTGFNDREDLGRAETAAWRRLSPRHRRCRHLADFDDRVGGLERQLTETQARIAGLLEQQRGAPQRDSDALAAWHLQDRKGPRPEPQAEALDGSIRAAEADRDGLQRAVDQVLAGKAEYVVSRRAQL